jgi:hypothetical protein
MPKGVASVLDAGQDDQLLSLVQKRTPPLLLRMQLTRDKGKVWLSPSYDLAASVFVQPEQHLYYP